MAKDPLITTVERHFLERKGRNPHATEEFSWLLSGITLATKIIAAYVQRAGLLEVMGATGRINVQGEEVQKLDDFANETLVRCLGYRGTIGILVSEEDDEPHVIQEAESGKYIVLFDPLDGSSNINANVSIGTIFSILQTGSAPPPNSPKKKKTACAATSKNPRRSSTPSLNMNLSASTSRPPTAAISCARRVRAPTRSSSRPPT